MGRECAHSNQIMAIQTQRMGKYLKIFERQMRKVTISRHTCGQFGSAP